MTFPKSTKISEGLLSWSLFAALFQKIMSLPISQRKHIFRAFYMSHHIRRLSFNDLESEKCTNEVFCVNYSSLWKCCTGDFSDQNNKTQILKNKVFSFLKTDLILEYPETTNY